VIPVIKTKRVSILDKFPYIKIRALKGTTINIIRAREEVQYTLVSRTPQAKGTSLILPLVEAGTLEAERSD
jgi:hypothetical protein